MLTEAQSSRLERRSQSLLQKKSISLTKEIHFSCKGNPLFSTEISTLFSREIFFSPRRNHLGWLQRERHEVKRPKSGTISSVPSSLTDLIKLSLSCRKALIDNHFFPPDFSFFQQGNYSLRRPPKLIIPQAVIEQR